MNKVAFEIALAVRGIHTTKAFSDVVGISRQTLAPIRAGHKEATVETAEQIRNALGLTNMEYAQIFPWQAEITAVKERWFV